LYTLPLKNNVPIVHVNVEKERKEGWRREWKILQKENTRSTGNNTAEEQKNERIRRIHRNTRVRIIDE